MAEENKTKGPIKGLAMMSKDDVVEYMNSTAEVFLRDRQERINIDRSEGNWPSKELSGESASANEILNDASKRLMLLERLGINKSTGDDYRLVIYDDGVNQAILTGVVEGSEFVAKQRLDGPFKGNSTLTNVVFENRGTFINLGSDEEIRIPVSSTTRVHSKKDHEHFSIEMIHLPVEQQKAVQSDVTLRRPKVGEKHSGTAMDKPVGDELDSKAEQSSIPQQPEVKDLVEKERSVLLAAGMSGSTNTHGPDGTSQVTMLNPSMKPGSKQIN